MSALFIGVGNVDRGDDAVGVWVAERLAEQGRHVLTCRGEATELMTAWEAHEDVVVFDAMKTGAAPGTVQHWDALDASFPVGNFTSSHEFGLAQAIELGRVLDQLPRTLVVYGIEGEAYDFGRTMSAVVRDAAQTLVTSLLEDSDA